MTTTPARPSVPGRPPLPPPRKRRLVRFAGAGVFTLLLAVIALPDLFFGLDRYTPFAQLVAFRPWLLLAMLGVLALLLVILGGKRRTLPFVAGTLAVLAVGAGMVAPRVIADPLPSGGTPLTVLAFNTLTGSADVHAVVELIRAQRPDLVSLSETRARFRARLAPLVEPLGYRLSTFTGPDTADNMGVTALVVDRLGPVQVRIGTETAAFPYVEVTGGSLGALRFVAFHAVVPMPGSLPEWASDLALLARWCTGPTPAVVAGDLNATLDHSALRSGMADCGDAGAQRGHGLVPTWGPDPGWRRFGPQIDHVIATDGIATEAFSVHDIEGSDHRAVLVTLRLPG